MDFRQHTDLTHLQLPSLVAYYEKKYLQSQQHDHLQIFENEHFLIPFSVIDKVAKSMVKSPFGSFLKLNDSGNISFPDFEEKVAVQLLSSGVDQVSLIHPTTIYADFVDSAELTKVGYQLEYNDVNQHIILSNDWEGQIHQMQARKLKSLKEEGFEFQQMNQSQVETIHQFLTVCRQAQGLQINISLEKLKQLTSELPSRYEFFSVSRDGKLSAVCITVNVTDAVAYYYLAGTSPLFRSHSPMVLLIAGMVDHYRNKGYSYFDLGVSSFEGQIQETLRLFKERMGALETKKPTFTKSLH